MDWCIEFYKYHILIVNLTQKKPRIVYGDKTHAKYK